LTQLASAKGGKKNNMFDQLVESKSNAKENTRRGEFLIGSFVVITSLFVGGLLYSLFAKDLGVSGGGLELSSLVTPVPVPEAEPPKPEPVQKQEKQAAETKTDVAVLKEAPVQDMDQSPTKIVETKSTKSDAVSASRVPDKFVYGDKNVIPVQNSGRTSEDGVGGGGGGGVPRPREVPPPVKEDEPPPSTPKPTPTPTPKPTPEKTPPPAPKTISGGVVNGKAVSLPKPPYPPAAKAVRASGAVNVQVTIDENGNVISASAVSGHPLLQAAAVSAARSAKFSPTMLSGQKVKVTGVIVYNFTAQ
jgi:periplasmic protein TonB